MQHIVLRGYTHATTHKSILGKNELVPVGEVIIEEFAGVFGCKVLALPLKCLAKC